MKCVQCYELIGGIGLKMKKKIPSMIQLSWLETQKPVLYACLSEKINMAGNTDISVARLPL